MKELLEDLRKLNEVEELNVEDVINILADTLSFDDAAEEARDLIEEGEPVTVNQETLDGYPITTISTEPLLNIMDYETFKDYLAEAAVDYKVEIINDWLEPYFNEEQYYKDCLDDRSLRDFILQQKDITRCEYASINGKDYVVLG